MASLTEEIIAYFELLKIRCEASHQTMPEYLEALHLYHELILIRKRLTVLEGTLYKF